VCQERSELRRRAEHTDSAAWRRKRERLEQNIIHARNGLQISRGMRAALEYLMAIVSALVSSYLVLRLGL